MSNSTPSTQTISVLICDDNQALRELLRVVIGLESDLHVAGEAGNGEEAIAEAERLQPDVILLDLAMPVLTGLDALPAIKAAAPRAHVVALTGFSADVVEEVVLRAGVDTFLEKGAHPDSITQTIRRAFAARLNGDRPSPATELQALAD